MSSGDNENEILAPAEYLPEYKFEPLPPRCQRFFVLLPCSADNKGDRQNYVRGTFEYGDPDSIGPYVAIKHGRGYRRYCQSIEVDGQSLLISATLEIFLRHFRTSDEPIRIWTRYLCLDFNDTEDKEYWTRPFVDSMYERSTQTVDMIEYIWNLLDSGTIAKLRDPTFVNREKDWDPPFGKVPLPQVCPIWLGAQPSFDGPYHDYRYVPLDPFCDEIRLIRLEPADDFDAPLVMHVYHEPMLSEVRYSAVSYTWGTSTHTVECFLSGQTIHIRQNLERCLRNLRNNESNYLLWVDAICINQNDLAERNRQVPRMGDIFYNAGSVPCYLGDADHTSELAMEFAGVLQGPMVRKDEDGVWDFIKQHQLTINDSTPSIAERCAALYRLLTRPYFRRVWIVQEIALASTPIIICGRATKHSRRFGEFAKAAHHIQQMMLLDDDLATEMQQLVPDKVLDIQELDYIRKLDYFRHLHRDRRGDFLQVSRTLNNSPAFLEIAIFMRQYLCGVEHDKIFAVWNLARDTSLMQYTIDYSKDAPRKYTDFAVSWAIGHGRLDVVGTVEREPETSADFYSQAPSWSTDWFSPSEVSCLVRRDRLPAQIVDFIDDQGGVRYMADGGMQQLQGGTQYFSFENDVLTACGVMLDVLIDIGEDETMSAGGNEVPTGSIGIQYKLGPVSERSKASQSDAETNMDDSECFSSRSESSQLGPNTERHDLRYLDTFYSRAHARYDDPHQAYWAMLCGDSAAAWPPWADNIENVDEDFPNEKYVCRPARREDFPNYPDARNRSRYITPFAGSYSRQDAWEMFHTIMRGRGIKLTAGGYMCLTPGYIEHYMKLAPCFLAILATCSVPVILQEAEDQPGKYRLLGNCFVQGWMDGGMVQGSNGTASAGSFWSSSEEVQQIEII